MGTTNIKLHQRANPSNAPQDNEMAFLASLEDNLCGACHRQPRRTTAEGLWPLRGMRCKRPDDPTPQIQLFSKECAPHPHGTGTVYSKLKTEHYRAEVFCWNLRLQAGRNYCLCCLFWVFFSCVCMWACVHVRMCECAHKRSQTDGRIFFQLLLDLTQRLGYGSQLNAELSDIGSVFLDWLKNDAHICVSVCGCVYMGVGVHGGQRWQAPGLRSRGMMSCQMWGAPKQTWVWRRAARGAGGLHHTAICPPETGSLHSPLVPSPASEAGLPSRTHARMLFPGVWRSKLQPPGFHHMCHRSSPGCLSHRMWRRTLFTEI